MSASPLWLLRPGSNALVEQNRITGDLDLPLSSLGKVQAMGMGKQLLAFPPQLIYCGPEQHAQETAELAARVCKARVVVTDAFRNWRLGLWQGMQLCELKHKSHRLCRQISECPEQLQPPEGEVISEVLTRLQKGWPRPKRWGTPVTFAVVAPDPLAGVIQRFLFGETNCEIRLLSNGIEPKQLQAPLVAVGVA